MRSAFQNCHPAVDMLYFFSVLLLGMLFFHPVLLGISFSAALTYSLRLRGRETAKLLFCFLLPTLLFVTAVNTVFARYGSTVLLTLPTGGQITLEAVVYGAVTGLMVVTVMLWFTCYNAVVTTDKFLYLFGRHLPTAALLFSVTLRFIPLSVRRLQKIREAQKGIGSHRKPLQSGLHALSVLITWSLENAVQVADSMKSRGYGTRGRTSYSRFFWSTRDTALCGIVLLSDALVAVGAGAGLTRAVYNPAIHLPPITGWSVLLFVTYAVLCFLPTATDAAEEYKWNKSR